MAYIDPNTEEGRKRILAMVTTMVDPSLTYEERYGPFVDEVIDNMKRMRADIAAGRLLTAAVACDQYAMGLSTLAVILIKALKQSEHDGALADDVARPNRDDTPEGVKQDSNLT